MKRLKRRRGSGHLIAFSSCAAISAVREELSQHAHLHRPDAAAAAEHGADSRAARQHLQESLDLYKTGLKVSEFTLQNARPPEEVRQAFDDAISAREDKSRIESEATAYASKIVPEALGSAARIKAESEGYRAATIAKATGDASRFRQLADQYRKAPEVTRKRLYLETMQDVLSSNQKVISAKGNILYLLTIINRLLCCCFKNYAKNKYCKKSHI